MICFIKMKFETTIKTVIQIQFNENESWILKQYLAAQVSFVYVINVRNSKRKKRTFKRYINNSLILSYMNQYNGFKACNRYSNLPHKIEMQLCILDLHFS